VVPVGARTGLSAHLHPHLLRHAFGDHVAKHAGLRIAQALLGHASLHTTASTYVDRPGLDEIAVNVHGLSFGGGTPTETPESRLYRQRDSNPCYRRERAAS
jgi:Phage integrase family